MIVADVQQQSVEWFEIRTGIPTVSCFDKILTGTKLTKSAQASTYRNELLAKALGCHEGFEGNEWTEQGNEREPEAVSAYEFVFDSEATEVGFIYRDERKDCGGSPDRLIADDGGLEIKCPKASTHIGYLLGGKLPTTYRSQVYGYLYVSGRSWWDFCSYHPRLELFTVRTSADDHGYLKWREKFEPALDAFIEGLNDCKRRLGIEK